MRKPLYKTTKKELQSHRFSPALPSSTMSWSSCSSSPQLQIKSKFSIVKAVAIELVSPNLPILFETTHKGAKGHQAIGSSAISPFQFANGFSIAISHCIIFHHECAHRFGPSSSRVEYDLGDPDCLANASEVPDARLIRVLGRPLTRRPNNPNSKTQVRNFSQATAHKQQPGNWHHS